jgi:hypothetical protein
MESERKYFAFFLSYFEAIEELPKKYQLAVYRAICRYSLCGEETPLEGVPKSIFISLKPALDKNRKKSENASGTRANSSLHASEMETKMEKSLFDNEADDNHSSIKSITTTNKDESGTPQECHQSDGEPITDNERNLSETIADNKQTLENGGYNKEDIIKNRTSYDSSFSGSAKSKQKGDKSGLLLMDNSTSKYDNEKVW